MLQSLLAIRVQKLFVIVLVLKVLASGLGWLLHLPWSLGFALPVALMVAYIALGLLRRDDDVSDEKFADSCYYIGFIFTITSIVFALFDLPNIGTQIESVAVRFGAAMVSTVLGLGVRVYLVSFQRDGNDAIEEAQDAVVDATWRFREQLLLSLERLRGFEADVDFAAKASVERVNLQFEALARLHADRLDGYLAELAQRNQEAYADQLSQVGVTAARLSEFVDTYSQQMRLHLTAMQQFTSATTDRVLEKLRTSEFPEDYFARHLEPPLEQLRSASGTVSDNVRQAAAAMSRASLMLITSMRKLRDGAGAIEGSLGSISQLAGQQRELVRTAHAQLEALQQFAGTLAAVDTQLRDIARRLPDAAPDAPDAAAPDVGPAA